MLSFKSWEVRILGIHPQVRGEVKRGEVKRGEESRSESDVTHPKNPKKKIKTPPFTNIVNMLLSAFISSVT